MGGRSAIVLIRAPLRPYISISRQKRQKDRTGIHFLAQCGVDGILSTKGQLIRQTREQGLFTVQRFFAVDSGGAEGIGDVFRNTNPHLMEIMLGVVTKVIKTCVIGDRIYTDVKSGLNAGVTGILVMSGETTEEILTASPDKPHLVLQDAGEILTALKNG